MKSILSFAALAVTAFALNQPAEAQTANAGANSTSSSGSSSGASSSSGSTSNSGASANQQRSQQRATNTSNTNTPITFNSTTPDRLTTNSNGTGTYTNNTNNSGYTSSDVTVRTTPTIYPPPVSGGNPCTLAISGGVSVIGWGAAAGGTFVDEDCAMRQKIAMIHNSGQPAAARELMCLDRNTYNAFKRVGQPCVFNAAFEPPGTPPTMGQQQPGPVVVTPAPAARTAGPIPGPQTLPRCNAARGIVDNCFSG